MPNPTGNRSAFRENAFELQFFGKRVLGFEVVPACADTSRSILCRIGP
ncbi:hypothetical protein [Rhodococcus sp. 1R11]|nr:hypothetical protein [Rhodococcus sp. 1R11]